MILLICVTKSPSWIGASPGGLCARVRTLKTSVCSSRGEWPSLSVQVVTFNRSAYLLQALQQIAAQDYPGPLEVVIMDDSPVAEQTSRFPEQLNVRYFHLPRATIGEKRNMAIAEARRWGAEILCIWDDDDVFTVDRLRQQVSRMVTRRATCSSIQVAFIVVLESGMLQRCKGLPLPFENSFCFTSSFMEGKAFSNCSLGEGNVIFESFEDWYSEAQPIPGEELPFLYVRTATATAPNDAVEPYMVESMLIEAAIPQVDIALLALARAFRKERFPAVHGPCSAALQAAEETLQKIMKNDLEKMKTNWSNTLQLAPAYWDALDVQKDWSCGGGVCEGSVNPRFAKTHSPVELVEFVPTDLLDPRVALELLEAALGT